MNPMTNVRNIQKLNESELRLGVSGSVKKSWHDQYKDSAWLFLGGLPYDLTEGDIICVFSQYGEVVNVNLVRDHKTGKSKGFCFLCYEDQKSTILAVDNLNGTKILSRTIRVDHVEEYKVPKEHGDEDELTKKIRSEGCAPKTPSASEDEGHMLLPPDKEVQGKVEKTKKKKKKEKTKKKHETSSDTDASSSDDSDRRKKKKMKKLKKLKKEKNYSSDSDSISSDDLAEQRKIKREHDSSRSPVRKYTKKGKRDSENGYNDGEQYRSTGANNIMREKMDDSYRSSHRVSDANRVRSDSSRREKRTSDDYLQRDREIDYNYSNSRCDDPRFTSVKQEEGGNSFDSRHSDDRNYRSSNGERRDYNKNYQDNRTGDQDSSRYSHREEYSRDDHNRRFDKAYGERQYDDSHRKRDYEGRANTNSHYRDSRDSYDRRDQHR